MHPIDHLTLWIYWHIRANFANDAVTLGAVLMARHVGLCDFEISPPEWMAKWLEPKDL